MTCTVSVAEGVTLTVEAGVQVVFDQSQSLYVYGNLVAVGTASQPIVFKGAENTSGYWGTLMVGGNGSGDSNASHLSYVTIEGSGSGNACSLYLADGTPTLDHLSIRNGGGDGLYASNTGPFTLDTATIENNAGDGIEIHGNGGQTLTNLTVRNNGGYGITTDHQAAVLTLSDSTISHNGVAGRLSVNALLQNNTWTGNARNEIELGTGTMTVSHTWNSQADAYRIVGGVTVADGVTLTVEPGVEVRFEEYRWLDVDGNLVAVGTASQPILFTSAAGSGVSGFWARIKIGGGSVSGDSDATHLSYVTIEGGGYSGQTSLWLQDSTPALDHLTIRHSGGDGLYASNVGSLDLEAVTIENNGGYGINLCASSGIHLSNSTISGNAVAARLPVDSVLANNTWTGNTRNEIEFDGGTIDRDVTWPRQAIPYRVVNGVTVADGAVLTIEPGVEVRFDEYRWLDVDGTLMAAGTASEPILFTSAAEGHPSGYWARIKIGGGIVPDDSNASRLSYVTIEDAGHASQGSLWLQTCHPSLDHLTIRNGGGDGLYGSDIGPVRLDAATIEYNAGYGINVYSGGSGMQVRSSTIAHNSVAARLPVNTVLEGNIWADNLRDELELNGGTISDDVMWSRQTSPYRVLSDVSVTAGVTLTVEAGVEVRFEQSRAIWVNGNLSAIGTAFLPISFVAAPDSSVLSWGGLIFDRGQGNLEYALIRDASADSGAVRLLNGAAVQIEFSRIISNTRALQVQSGSAVIIGSEIAGNSEHGVFSAPEAENSIDASYNWWGDASGPWHEWLNPEGQGDRVSDNVEFRPWLTGDQYDPWTARQPLTLSLDTPVEGIIVASGFRDFVLPITGNLPLLVEVTPLSDIQSLWLYSRLGEAPTLATYDSRTTEATVSGIYTLMISPTRTGVYHLTLFANQVTSSQGRFRIVARAVERYLADVAPRSAGNAGQATLHIQGLGFTEGMQVQLRADGLPTLTAADTTLLSGTSVKACFDLGGVALGRYDVKVTWPDGEVQTMPAVLSVTQGVGSRLRADFTDIPVVRTGRTYALSLRYENTGDSDMVAPLLIIRGLEDPVVPYSVPMRLSTEEPFEPQPVQVLGTNPAGPNGVLPPGSTGELQIYFVAPPRSPANPYVAFDLQVMLADDTPIDWNAVEAEVRPADVDPEVWNVFWPVLTAQIGATWADYNRVLADDATYLGTLGRAVYSVRDLFRFEVRKALGLVPRTVLADALDASCPEPGPALRFGRVFPGTLEGRFYLGPLGRGWSHEYDITLEELSDGSVRGHWPGGFLRQFRRNADGTYTALFGDHGKLVKDASLFVLTEKDATVYRFRSDGKLDTIQDGNGNRISTTYDGRGQLVQVSHSSGDSFTLAYNSQGRIATLTDQAGRITAYGYDASGEHLLTVTASGGRATSYAYHPATGQPADHALLSVARPDGTHRYYAYDSQGRLSAEWRDGDAEHVTYSYATANRIAVTDAHGQTAFIFPDEYGRPARLKDALGNQLDIFFDAQFNLARITDPAGQPYRFTYDNLGNPIAAEDPLADRVTLGYDYRFSRLALLRDARANESGFVYDGAGNLTTLTYPDDSTEVITYDATGNPLTYTDRAGQTTAYTHNARGQLTRKDYPDGSWAAYIYDAAGNLTSAADPNGALTMTYDPATNWLTRVTYPTGQYFAYTYNAAGQRTRRSDQDGRELNYAYDAAGRLTRIYDEHSADIVQYAYDAAGRLDRKTLGNGTSATYEYDAAGQLIHLVHRKADATILSRFDYAYDPNGNRNSMTTLGGTTTYTFDPLGQLTGASYPDGRQVTYAYDPAGNRTVVTENGTPASYTTNNLNQYTQVGAATYTYDANGSLASLSEDGETTRYFYDYENRLVRVETPSATVTYGYDPLGRRIARTDGGGTVRYLLDGDHVAAELDATNAVAARYVQGADVDEVLLMERGGNDYWYHLDALGSVRDLTDADGHMLESYDYDAYGQPNAGSAVGNPWYFTGREYESDVALQFNRGRYYSPHQGRFITTDPVGIRGGPNLYVSAGNNPIRFVDPYGLSWLDTVIGTVSVATGIVSAVTSGALAGGMALVSTFFGAVGVGMSVGELLLSRYVDPDPWWFHPLWGYDWYTLGGDSARVVTPYDPNEKLGPTGVGDDRLVSNDEELQYTVYFENQTSATAPAQEVFITDTLDANLDWTTFRPIEIAFGDTLIPISDGTLQYADRPTVTDYRPDVNRPWWVDIAVEANPFKGKAVWTFRTLDPDTDELPEDALAGFLPPDDGSGRGQGHVTFGIRPRRDLPDGTRLSNQADIVFDTNEPVSTNEVWHKTMTPGHLDVARSAASVELTWLHLSSQVDHYEVYRSTNPYLIPGGLDSQKLDDVAAPQEFRELSYPDTEGLTPPVTGYYYIVQAVKANGEVYFTSNRTGVFGFGLTPDG